ncbi:GTPase, G3E family [Bacteroidales bacterium WCE2008]|nr:GTPase, G3E family [Bacteroidales bacterium WCE2008]
MTINIEKKEIPVLLLTGYLGSGKTTLVNRILSNRKGIRFAVIVNDIGEVNIDADLIQKGGIVGQSDDSLVALQNGCICCTLKMDLVQQISDLTRSDRFDYIVIEASGICEPAPIAQTILNIPALGPQYNQGNTPVMDCIVTVVDALRMQSEFACGDDLTKKDLGEEDIERLLIEQIEFCNIVLLNKASEVTPEERGRIKEIIHALNPKATIFECDYGDIDLDRIVGTGMFDFDKVATSAAWISEIEGDHDDDDDDDDDHDHDHEHDHEHHHHHHHDDEGEAEEYGIGTFVYYQRRPLDLNKFDYMVARKWPKSIIRAKGLCYFAHETDKCYLFEQAGVQKTLRDAGLWFATMPEDQLEEMMKRDKVLRRDWDEKYGDRMNKIVFIGQHLDKAAITELMDGCLADQDLS